MFWIFLLLTSDFRFQPVRRFLFNLFISIISENMETTDKILVYDDACPLCVAYTGAFVKTGLLTAEGRKSF